MKKKTFFYKFDKNIDKYSASNHSHISEKNNEEHSAFKIMNLLGNEKEIIEKIDIAKEFFTPYYEQRNISKINILEKK
jgi:hypothetical protein